MEVQLDEQDGMHCGWQVGWQACWQDDWHDWMQIGVEQELEHWLLQLEEHELSCWTTMICWLLFPPQAGAQADWQLQVGHVCWQEDWHDPHWFCCG